MRTIAQLARSRAERGSAAAHRDGLERLRAERALRQLAADLDATAEEFEHRPQNFRPRG